MISHLREEKILYFENEIVLKWCYGLGTEIIKSFLLVTEDTAQGWSYQCMPISGYCLIFLLHALLSIPCDDRQLPQNNIY